MRYWLDSLVSDVVQYLRCISGLSSRASQLQKRCFTPLLRVVSDSEHFRYAPGGNLAPRYPYSESSAVSLDDHSLFSHKMYTLVENSFSIFNSSSLSALNLFILISTEAEPSFSRAKA